MVDTEVVATGKGGEAKVPPDAVEVAEANVRLAGDVYHTSPLQHTVVDMARYRAVWIVVPKLALPRVCTLFGWPRLEMWPASGG